MRVVVAFALALVMAGCAAPPSGRVVATLDQPRGDDPASRTLDAAPQWAAGEWFRFQTTDVFTRNTTNVTVVVAGATNESYLLGLPMDEIGLLDNYVTLHLPPLGNITRSNLSFPVHNFDFATLRFPLRDGDTWRTHFEFSYVNMTVHVIDRTTA